MVLVDSYNEGNKNAEQRCGFFNSTIIGQSFTSNGGILAAAKFYLSRRSGVSGNIVAKIFSQSEYSTYGTDSKPGELLATSDSVAASAVSEDVFTLVTFTFTSENKISLVDGTKYIVAIDYSSASDFPDTVVVGLDDSSPSHSGNKCYFNGGTWYTDADSDVVFYVYKDDPPTASAEISAVASGVATTDGERQAVSMGKTAGSAERDVIVAGKIRESAERLAVLHGDATSTLDRQATTTGKIASTSERTGKTSGKDSATTEREATATGKQTSSDDRAAIAKGQITGSGERNAKTIGTSTYSGEMSAGVVGSEPAASERSASTDGKLITTAEIFATLTGRLPLIASVKRTMIASKAPDRTTLAPSLQPTRAVLKSTQDGPAILQSKSKGKIQL